MKNIILGLGLILALAGSANASGITNPPSTGGAEYYGSLELNVTATGTGLGWTYTETGTLYPVFGMVAGASSGITLTTGAYTSTMTVVNAGTYHITFTGVFANSIADALYDVVLVINGTITEVGTSWSPNEETQQTSVSFNTIRVLGAGDIIAVQTQVNTPNTGTGILISGQLTAEGR